MPKLQRITDPGDARLHEYIDLRDVQLRRSLEEAEGIFIAEGEKVIRRALAAGYRPRSLLLAERWLAPLADALDGRDDLEVFVADEALVERVTGFHVHRGALGSFARKVPWELADVLRGDRLVVAEDIVDHTNVGALLRSAAGLGWDGALFAPRAADPLYRRSIKVSMGAVFSLPWARLPSHHDAVGLLREAGFTVAALALSDDAEPLDAFAPRVHAQNLRVALLLGTEGDGLSRRWLGEADTVVTIPMHQGIDSLNVAAAAAVACYAIGPAVKADAPD